jgi:hypothetical protein
LFILLITKITARGSSYANVVNFLKSLEKEGFVSYPSTFKVERVEKGMLKGDLTILVIMKEEKT